MTTRAVNARPVKVTTPWGPATVVEELHVRQRVGERRFKSIVQLLEDEKGAELIRFAYRTGGTTRRGPVTLRRRDLERLRSELATHPRVARALGLPASQFPEQSNVEASSG